MKFLDFFIPHISAKRRRSVKRVFRIWPSYLRAQVHCVAVLWDSMPPKAGKGKDTKATKTAAKPRKEGGGGGGKAKKKKWSKGKVRDKLNNMVLFDPATYDKLYKEVVAYRLITPSVVSERLKVRVSLAKAGLRELHSKGILSFSFISALCNTFNITFDIYRKVPKDLTQPTVTGAVISICSLSFIAYLFAFELFGFLKGDIITEMFVDNPDTGGKIPVFLNASLLKLPCEYSGLDIQDEMGRHDVGFIENVEKKPIEDGQGCLIIANFQISKVPGNFHLSTHSSKKKPPAVPDMRHIIHSLTFGTDLGHLNLPGSFRPLTNVQRVENQEFPFSHDYVIKIVPTVHENIRGVVSYSYQYTYAHKQYLELTFAGTTNPTVWFHCDLTPITVKYHERRPPVYTFLTTICAIIGGTFTVAGLIDSFVFSTYQFYKKLEIGKLS
ncbi:hypothetical protein M514_03426 [Trichuris suis]|uniref:Small ribosomal subunit protein eS25 n=1 Tax=Trichuris suis TaxID=68888 RepID=A0A085NF44_9BILA|nr:hypothetical protein M513_03426 [Trichuris suis]KFD68090.1 hypothetical protein M514_03426 [Trichuris suis]